MGLNPVAGTGIDLYEAITVTNFATGEPLTDFERGVAVLGSLTGGLGSKVLRSGKLIGKVVDGFGKLLRASGKGLDNLDDIADAAKIIEQKTDFILGKATGSKHNRDRSRDMLNKMEEAGLPDNPETRKIISENLMGALKDPSSIKEHLGDSRVLRESLISGRNGHLRMDTIWEGNELITIRLKGGKKWRSITQ